MTTIALPNDDVLQHMAEEHVLYEFARVVEFTLHGNSVPIIVPSSHPGLQDEIVDWVRSAILESGVVHVRNIADFLTKPRPTRPRFETDLVADQYFCNGWSNRPRFIFGADQAEHESLMGEIHRRVVHLSTQRYTVAEAGAFDWRDYVREQLPHLLGSFRLFLDDLAAEDAVRASWFSRCDMILKKFFEL